MKNCIKILNRLALSLLLLIGISITLIKAQERIKFSKGSTSTIVTGKVSSSKVIHYVIAAKAGQKLILEVTGLVNLSIESPKGESVSSRVTGQKAIYNLSTNGDYTIEVQTSTDTEKAHPFTLKITIPAD